MVFKSTFVEWLRFTIGIDKECCSNYWDSSLLDALKKSLYVSNSTLSIGEKFIAARVKCLDIALPAIRLVDPSRSLAIVSSGEWYEWRV